MHEADAELYCAANWRHESVSMLGGLKKVEGQLGSSKFRLLKYKDWLDSQPFAAHTKCNYFSQVKQFLVFVQNSNDDYKNEEMDPVLLVQDYRRFLLNSVKASPGSVNKSLTAVDNFYRFLGIAPAAINREKLLAYVPRVLTSEEQHRLFRALAGHNSKKDKAVIALFFHTAIRLSECAALNVADVCITASGGTIMVHNNRNGSGRHVPLNVTVGAVLQEWLIERKNRLVGSSEEALFLNQEGKRISSAGLDLIVRKIGIHARLVLSAQRLRDTCLARLAQNSKDISLVTRLAGYKRSATARKYLNIDLDSRRE